MQWITPSPKSPDEQRHGKVAYWAALAAAAACVTPAYADTHTVSWFLGHEADRKEMVAQCDNDPGTAKYTPNCTNALEASLRSHHSSLPPTPTNAQLCAMMPPAFKVVNRCK